MYVFSSNFESMKTLRFLFLATLVAAFSLVSCSDGSNDYAHRVQALDGDAWNSSVWISAADAAVVSGPVVKGNMAAAPGSSWFVSNPINGGKVVTARWMVTSLGVSQIYVNGQAVGEEFLRPGFTHYQKTRLSFTYDCTPLFDTASDAINQLSAQVTPGWWADKVITPSGCPEMRGRKCAFRSVLELTYEDGTKELFGTDTLSWKAGIAGPVKKAAIFDGEYYDAHIAPGYETASILGTPEENLEFQGEIIPSEGAEVYLRRDLAMSPVKAYVWKDIEGTVEGEEYGKVVTEREYESGEVMTILPGETLVVDFGQNCAGVPEFEFMASDSTVLTCLPSEILNDGNGALSRGMDGPGGSCHRLNLRQSDWAFVLEYTFGPGNEYVKYHPECTFFGYRYVSVSATDKVEIKSISSIPVSSVTDELQTGKIVTGCKDINQLLSNAWWGEVSNYLSVPTDCPQRDERLGWTADTQVFSETGAFFADTRSFFHKWMRDMRDSQKESGAFSSVAPAGTYGSDFMRFGWADAGIIVPWTIWKQYADTAIVNENWEAMDAFLAHVTETQYEHSAIKEESGGRQYADWLSFEPLETCSGKAFETDKDGKRTVKNDAIEYWDYLSSCYWAMDAGMMADMAGATGRDAGYYRSLNERVRGIIREKYLNEDGSFKLDILNTMQTPAVFALGNNLVHGQAKENLKERLKENFASHGGCLQTGFLGTSILMDALTENGMADIAWDLLFQRKNPSWLYSIDNGATTIWERWNSYTIENGMGPKSMNSFNHYAYGSVCGWIWKTAAGIDSDPAYPGFKRIIMKPIPDKRLGSMDAEYRSVAGVIRSKWKFEPDGKWIWTFSIPSGSTALVTLPGENEAREYGSGSHTVRMALD